MFRKYFGIQLDNPCSEGWENMLPADRGRFCNSCSKQVIDFTAMKDAEIMAYFRKHKNVCGRIHRDQMDRNLLPTGERQSFLKRAFAAMLLMFQSLISEAQTADSSTRSVVVVDEDLNDYSTPICTNKIPGDSGFFKTTLQVIDSEDKSTIFNARIILNGDTLECRTSTDGKLIFELPLHYKDSTVNLKVMKDDYVVYNHDMLLDGNLFIIMLTKVIRGSKNTIEGNIIINTSTRTGRQRPDNDLYRKYPGLFRDF